MFRLARLHGYFLSLLMIVAAVGGRVWAQYMGWGPFRFPFFEIAVILSAWFFGAGPGVFAAVLATIGWLIFFPPIGTFELERPVDAVHLISFAAINLAVAWAFSTARRKSSKVSSTQSPSLPSQSADEPAAVSRAGAGGEKIARLSLDSPFLFAGLLMICMPLMSFGWWGACTPAGMRVFDEDKAIFPLICLCIAPVILGFGIAFLPIFSFKPPARPISRQPR